MPPERQKRIAAQLWTESMKISEIWLGLRKVSAQPDSWRVIAPARAREATTEASA
jgi:hypothetical protein